MLNQCYYYSYSTNTYITGWSKDIRIHKAIADQIRIVNIQTKIQSTWQLINMELKENLLEIEKKKQLPELLKMSD